MLLFQSVSLAKKTFVIRPIKRYNEARRNRMYITFTEKEDNMSKVIFVVDLGHFKAYRVTKDPFEKSPKTELIESYDSLEARLKLSDKLSDAAGRYRQAGGRNGKGAGFGEAHNIALESDKRIIKQIAADISEIVSREKCEKWCLAAPKDINNQILEHLEQHLRAKLDKNIPSNLTKTGKTELLAYFGNVAPAY